MPAGREYYNVHILDVDEKQLLKIRRAMLAHEIPIHIELVVVPPSNINPLTNKPYTE